MDYKKKYLKYKLKYLNAKKLYGGMQSPPPNFQDEILQPNYNLDTQNEIIRLMHNGYTLEDIIQHYDSQIQYFNNEIQRLNNENKSSETENPLKKEIQQMIINTQLKIEYILKDQNEYIINIELQDPNITLVILLNKAITLPIDYTTPYAEYKNILYINRIKELITEKARKELKQLTVDTNLQTIKHKFLDPHYDNEAQLYEQSIYKMIIEQLEQEQMEQDLQNYFDGGSLDEEFRLVLTEANNKKRFLDIENPQVRELKEMLGEKFYNASVDDYLEKKDIDVRFDEFYEDTISLIEKRETALIRKGIDYEKLKKEFLDNPYNTQSLFEFITDLENTHNIVIN